MVKMKFNPDLHSGGMRLKSMLSYFDFSYKQYSASDLIVVNYHGTQKKFIHLFAAQLDFLNSTFNIIHPDCITDYFNDPSKVRGSRPKLLITFDDGLKNNLYAVDELDKRGIKALFFIIPGFVNTSVSSQKEYFTNQIRPLINKNIDIENHDFLALSWDDLKGLFADGHRIGSHSFSHTLTSDSNREIVEHEIKDSKYEISSKTDISPEEIRFYCCPNETFTSTGIPEHKIIKQNYRFFFTTFAGSNQKIFDPYLICRTNVESYWPFNTFKYAIGKMDWWRWKGKIRKFRKLVRQY